MWFNELFHFSLRTIKLHFLILFHPPHPHSAVNRFDISFFFTSVRPHLSPHAFSSPRLHPVRPRVAPDRVALLLHWQRQARLGRHVAPLRAAAAVAQACIHAGPPPATQTCETLLLIIFICSVPLPPNAVSALVLMIFFLLLMIFLVFWGSSVCVLHAVCLA